LKQALYFDITYLSKTLQKSDFMKLLSLVLISFMIFFSPKLYSQAFEVPLSYELKIAADYARYEKDIIAAAKWLKKMPFDMQIEKRRLVSKFVVEWVNGSPTVNVEITPVIMDFEKKNKGMLVLYMACCAQYVLENNYSKDMRAKHKAALRDMMLVYKSGNEMSKDKKMDKLIKLDEEGKIDEWLEENLKINSN
jgi:hypothetical protein